MAQILIADDSVSIRKFLRRLISEHPGWMVCGEASNGEEAISMASQLKPDLVVLDITMPVMDGFRAAEAILRATPGLPIVMYTLHKSEQIALEAKKAGASRMVVKADDPDALVNCLVELLPVAEQPVERSASAANAAASGSEPYAPSTEARRAPGALPKPPPGPAAIDSAD